MELKLLRKYVVTVRAKERMASFKLSPKSLYLDSVAGHHLSTPLSTPLSTTPLSTTPLSTLEFTRE